MTSFHSLSHSKQSTPFAQKILRKINDEQVSPRPRWIFLLRNRALWIFAFFAVLLASVATAAAMFALLHADWQYALITHRSLIDFLTDSLPFLWFGILILFSGIGYVQIHTTDYGYRYSFAISLVGIVIAVLGLGTILFMSGIGQIVEEGANYQIPWYESVLYKKQSWWNSPAQGFLFGTITSQNQTSFYLTDSFGKQWMIDFSEVPFREQVNIRPGTVVRMVGIPSNMASARAQFHACFIMPWHDGVYKTIDPPSSVTRFAHYVPIPHNISETISPSVRNKKCRGIRSYKLLRTLDTP